MESQYDSEDFILRIAVTEHSTSDQWTQAEPEKAHALHHTNAGCTRVLRADLEKMAE